MWEGAEMANCTPDSDRSRIQGGAFGCQEHHEAVIRGLKEKSFNFVIVGAVMISFVLVHRITVDALKIETIPPPLLYVTVLWGFSDQTSPPPTFDMPSTRGIIRTTVYCVSSVIFYGSAAIVAMLGRRMVRNHRDRLQVLTQPQSTEAQIPNFSAERERECALDEAVNRLLLVGIVILCLGIVDRVVIAVNPTVLALVVVWGWRFAFGGFKPTNILK